MAPPWPGGDATHGYARMAGHVGDTIARRHAVAAHGAGDARAAGLGRRVGTWLCSSGTLLAATSRLTDRTASEKSSGSGGRYGHVYNLSVLHRTRRRGGALHWRPVCVPAPLRP